MTNAMSKNGFESPCIRRNLESAAMPAARALKHHDMTVDLPYTKYICEQNNTHKDEIFFSSSTLIHMPPCRVTQGRRSNNNDFPKQ